MVVSKPLSLRLLVVASSVTAGVFAQAQVTGFSGFAAGNGSANLLDPNTLQLTDGMMDSGGAEHQVGSAFYASKVDVVDAWTATFHYVALTDPSYPYYADGITFAVQNDPRGTSALGDAGGGLGYGDISGSGNGIVSSAAFSLNIWNNFDTSPRGTDLLSNGSIDYNYTPLGDGIDLLSPAGVDVTLTYSNGLLNEHFQQGALSWDWPGAQAFNISALADPSGMAYIGFTGGDGLGLSDQRISNFQFGPTPTPEPCTLVVLAIGGIGLAVRRRRAKTTN